MIRTLALAALAGLCAAPAFAQPPAALPTPEFITAAAQTDAFERQEGRLALTRAVSPQVHHFASQMVIDHNKTTVALKAAIARAGLPAPPPPTLSDAQARELAALQSLHGGAFDRAYVDQQVATHEQALGLMQAYAAGGDNPVLKQAAADTVPIVQHHLEMARGLHPAP